ncbi:adenylyltransferase/cytidyltransferase family protein [Alkalicoccus luteus]|uniref:Adenylyltransferase/cytidyltransferase family protein n=1 Tax=Alkalicoccus luteus TaxID=1237094 RepID=A0A969PSM2_9BACI|nr:adenylyltransferase/cytidyltransferase family protein [Alkalicoccus luteus]NJP38775.1 adenylyltransferase/cytidyltransferase family protein [Alkalicoccus luteus]
MKQYKTGYTTGVFDLFHIGHLTILEKAKSQCSHLIVGVSTDDLVMKSKNKLPVIPFAERISIIAALSCVDEVVPQWDKNKYAAWERLRFDAMFVGDDWKGSSLFQETEQALSVHGVDVIYFPYTKGISSTMLTEKLKVMKISELEEQPWS